MSRPIGGGTATKVYNSRVRPVKALPVTLSQKRRNSQQFDFHLRDWLETRAFDLVRSQKVKTIAQYKSAVHNRNRGV